MPPPSRQPGDYPNARKYETINKTVVRISPTQSFLVVKYETSKSINLYIGGHVKWCIQCDIIKRDNVIQQVGYLNQVRYDIKCSLEHSFVKGIDTKQIIYFTVQYIKDKYPEVKGLIFSDLSTRVCDNNVDVNLAVMTYLYSEQTWYEKNFGAYIAPMSETEYNIIRNEIRKTKDNKNKVSWEVMSETITNEGTKMTDAYLEELYNKSNSWKEFFEPIYDKLKIDKFCIYISSWLPKFINKYFNTLQGLKYILPIRDNRIVYVESEYNIGGRRFTRKSTRKQDKDYK
jgi:hypothetical protein